MTDYTASMRPASAGRTRRHTAVGLAGALLILIAGGLHLVLVPEYLSEAPVIGVLFLLSGPFAAVVAWWLWRHEDAPAWLLGIALAGGMIVGFVLSRTVGLLGYRSQDWAEGVPSLAVEALFVVLAAVSLLRAGPPRRGAA